MCSLPTVEWISIHKCFGKEKPPSGRLSDSPGWWIHIISASTTQKNDTSPWGERRNNTISERPRDLFVSSVRFVVRVFDATMTGLFRWTGDEREQHFVLSFNSVPPSFFQQVNVCIEIFMPEQKSATLPPEASLLHDCKLQSATSSQRPASRGYPTSGLCKTRWCVSYYSAARCIPFRP
jgi:hypothetical protein